MKKRLTKKEKELQSNLEYRLSQLSWNRPIEENLLKFVRHMAEQFETKARYEEAPRGFFKRLFYNNSLSEGAKAYADAYRTVERQILSEMEIRGSLTKR